ncbi:MAG: DUF3552 domain-containing protein, partial [Phycisphaerae bacterium]|nr:DUF3552 domain-containing protein [Phycisphaerae bacterium]
MTAYILLAAMEPGPIVAIAFAAAILAVCVTAYVMKLVERTKRDAAEKELDAQRIAAEAQAQKIVAQAEAQAQSQLLELRKQFDSETEGTRKELRGEEKRLAKREDMIDQKLETAHSKERMVDAAEKAIAEREKGLAAKDRQLNEIIGQQKAQLLKVANLSMEEARSILLGRIEKDIERDAAALIQKRLEDAKETADTQAREIIITS